MAAHSCRRACSRASWRPRYRPPLVEPPSLIPTIAQAQSLLAPKIVERARALAQQFLAPIVKILRAAKSEAEINELLLFGALTSHEATIIDGDSRVESVFNRLLCLELGQALAAFGHDAEGCDVLRATADCFGSTNVASSVDGEAGKFLREVYTQLGLVTEKLHGTAAAHSVYELAVARGVWRHPLQRPQDVFQTSLRGLVFWDAASLPCARALALVQQHVTGLDEI